MPAGGVTAIHDIDPIEPAEPAHFRIWRLNPKCASGTPCNSATDPPLQGPVHEGQFPHAGRSFVGLSTDAPADVSLVHVLELEPASASYRVLVCDVAKLGLHLPLPCSYYQPSTPLLQPSPCTAFATSAACLAVEGCGWCASSSTCLLGDEVGPCSATCPAATWAGGARNASARGATPRALSQPGEYQLGRVGLCPGFRGYEGSDRLLVIASENDAVNKLLVSNGVDIEQNLLADAAQGRGETTMYAALADAYAERTPPKRGAFIYKEGGTPPAGAKQNPNHISFLWESVDDAMIELLSPFLGTLVQVEGIVTKCTTVRPKVC